MPNKRRKNGEGTWGKKQIKGVPYVFYRNSEGKYFYGKTEKEVNEKRKKHNSNLVTNKTTFGEYMLWYFNYIHKNSVEISTHDEYIRVANVIINCPHYDIGSIQLASFSGEKNYIKEYIDAITPHYSLNYIKNQYTKIKLVVKYAEKNGQIIKGLLDDVKIPKEARVGKKAKKIPFLTKDIANQMYGIIDNKYYNGSKKYGFYYWVSLLIMHTGMRSEEARAIQLQDIDFDKKQLSLNKAIVKITGQDGHIKYIKKSTKNTQSERIIPLNSVAIDMLHRIIGFSHPQKGTDYVCITKNDGYLNNAQIARATDRLLRDINADVKHCNPHALRHTFGSILFEQDVDLKIISELLGHKNITTTANIYISLTNDQKKNAVLKLEPMSGTNEEE